jgi:hypothetical protein
MNSLARVLALLLVLIFVDAAMKFGMYRRMVHSATGAYCTVAKRSQFERFDCTNRIFYSKPLWVVISVLVGGGAGYVAMEAMRTKSW